jgi:hypothetical protein
MLVADKFELPVPWEPLPGAKRYARARHDPLRRSAASPILNRNRQLAKDFEATIGSNEAWLYLASVPTTRKSSLDLQPIEFL